MAKRFTDNEKWKDAWFMDLPSKYKLFWIYILDDCNHAGIWKVNFKTASFHIGEHLEHSEVIRMFKNRIGILNNEYWYIEKFIKYQYKCDVSELNTKNKAHLSIIKLLNEFEIFKPLTSPLLGVKDKDKDKDKEIVSIIKKEITVKYTDLEFIERWRSARLFYFKQPYYKSKLESFDKRNLDIISNIYTKEQIDSAIKGMFEQKGILKHLLLQPTHFLKLENFEMYLTCASSGENVYDKPQQLKKVEKL